jgi:hypothetical protein
MTYISRDPFARLELHRHEMKSYISKGCTECGNRNARGNLFQYVVESDGGRRNAIEGEFCSIGCMRAYHCLPTE